MIIYHFKRLIFGKRKKILPLISMFVTILLVLFGSSYVSNKTLQYISGVGYNYENVIALTPRLNRQETSDPEIFNGFDKTLKKLKGIEEVSFTDGSIPFHPCERMKFGFRYKMHQFLTFSGDEHLNEVLGFNLVDGRWFVPDDRNAQIQPVVLTQKAVNTLFDKNESGLVGKIIESDDGKQRYKIIGIVDKFKTSFDDIAPVWLMYNEQPSRYILIRHQAAMNLVLLDEEIRSVLNLLSVTDVSENDLTEGVSLHTAREELFRKHKEKISLLAIIASFVFINVMIIFLVSTFNYVRKRKHEIGIRRAVGATRRSTYSLILVENLIFTSVAYITAFLVFIQLLVMLPPIWERQYVLIGVLGSTFFIYALIVVCTLYPARQAARIQPVEALAEE